MEEYGGEKTCFLSNVDESGMIADPRTRIAFGPGGRALTGPYRPLAPRSDETADQYRARLEEPEARTAAWQAVLAAEDTPVVLAPPDREDMGEALLAYLRELMS